MKTTKTVLSIGLGVVIALSVFALPYNLGMKVANADVSTLTMKTSADDLGKKFFGDSLLQVIIEDPAADSSLADTIDVSIEVRDNTGALLATATPTISDTSAGSQRFEFFLANISSTITPQNPDGPGTILTIGNGGDIDIGGNFNERFTVKIVYKTLSTTITYDDTSSTVSADRDNYGSDNLVFLSVTDQDGNADPTNRDVILSTNSGADKFITMSGVSSVGNSTCTETGENSAVFECEWTIAAVAGAGKLVPTDFSDNAIAITVQDVSQYMEDTGDGEITAADTNAIDSNLKSGQSFESITIDDADGEIGPITAISTSSELKFTLADTDRDLSSKAEDDISADGGTFTPGVDSTSNLVAEGVEGLYVYIDAVGGDSEAVPMTETQDSSGSFIPDLSNDELPITFLPAGQTPTADNGILEFTSADITEDIIIAYVDPAADGGPFELASTVTKSLDTTAGKVEATGTVGINADFTVTITDSDLNDNPRTKDSYKLVLRGDGDADAGSTTEFQFTKGSDSISDDGSDALYQTMEVELKGTAANFNVPPGVVLNYTFTETGDNTGIFTANLDMGDILAAVVGGTNVDDGDAIDFTLHDYMEDPDKESHAEVTIGRASSAVDFSRDDVPIPPEVGEVTETALGSAEVIVTVSVTDPDSNTQTGSEDTITLDLTGVDRNAEFRFDGANFDVNTATTSANPTLKTGVTAQDIIVETLQGLTLEETGANTGVFEEDLTFVRGGAAGGGDLTLDDYQDLRVTMVYINSQGDRDSSGITFRGHDAVVDVDKAAVTSGAILTVTVQDDDLNLDGSSIEEFDGSFNTSDELLSMEIENDDITQSSNTGETFTETGEDTGIFTAEFEVGKDITVIDVAAGDQASNIHITYNDEIDSSGSSGQEVEVDVPVVSATGAIQVKPDLVGPGTEITVLVTDSDLNEKASGKDTIAADPDVLEFKSDRREVSSSGVEMEETGADTGVFQFTIQLVTDQKDCADDDLSDDKYDAEVQTSGDQGVIGACPGDLIAIAYTDEHNADGNRKTVSKVVEVKSWDPEFVADKTAYNIGDKATISISDPDANRDPDVADTLRDIRVSSETDQVGEELSAIETGKDTGVFKLSFAITGTATSGGIEVTTGDTVTVRYTDDFPADFQASEEDKDFKYTFTVGTGPAGPGAVTPTAPLLKDATGKELTSVIVGQQVVLSTTIVNNQDKSQTHATILEVRDGNGVTVFIGWGTGTLAAKASTSIGLSWTPDNPGSYTLRTFVLSDLATPQILSNPVESKITVS